MVILKKWEDVRVVDKSTAKKRWGLFIDCVDDLEKHIMEGGGHQQAQFSIGNVKGNIGDTVLIIASINSSYTPKENDVVEFYIDE